MNHYHPLGDLLDPIVQALKSILGAEFSCHDDGDNDHGEGEEWRGSQSQLIRFDPSLRISSQMLSYAIEGFLGSEIGGQFSYMIKSKRRRDSTVESSS